MLFYQPQFELYDIDLYGYVRKSSKPDDKQAASIPKQKKFIYQPSELYPDTHTIAQYFEEKESAKKAGIRSYFPQLLTSSSQSSGGR